LVYLDLPFWGPPSDDSHVHRCSWFFAKIKDHPTHLTSVTVTRPLMWPFPADLMRARAISTKVNKPKNDVKLIQLATDAAGASTAACSRRPSQASKYSCVQRGHRLGDQFADRNNMNPGSSLGRSKWRAAP
jgi:hypothetical protein